MPIVDLACPQLQPWDRISGCLLMSKSALFIFAAGLICLRSGQALEPLRPTITKTSRVFCRPQANIDTTLWEQEPAVRVASHLFGMGEQDGSGLDSQLFFVSLFNLEHVFITQIYPYRLAGDMTAEGKQSAEVCMQNDHTRKGKHRRI